MGGRSADSLPVVSPAAPRSRRLLPRPCSLIAGDVDPLTLTPAILSGMPLKRMDNVGVVVDDLAAAVAFFKELGLELEGEAQVRDARWTASSGSTGFYPTSQ